MKRLIPLFIFICGLVWVSDFVFAGEIAIFATGETHAMLYPCSCPKEVDGGIARRATLIRQLESQYPDALVLDSGNFFAGGLRDEYTQNTQLDKKRTQINLKAMELMDYDAAAIGDAEFNFGKDFLLENIDKTKLPYLSCNINFSKFTPYIIKEVGGIKVGIIGLTAPLTAQKAGGLKFIDPKPALATQVGELKKNGVTAIVLLSNLNGTDNLSLINDIKGVDILIGNGPEDRPFAKVAGTFVVRPAWQGRRLDKITFSIKDNKVTDFKVEELRLSDKIKDDPGIQSILPACFSNGNCKKDGLEGKCVNPAEANASCLFEKAKKQGLLVITASQCRTCNTKDVIDSLKAHFPGLDVSYLYYPGRKANKLVKDLGITALPAYLFFSDVEKDKKFVHLKQILERKGGYYLLSPEAGGIAYFINRKKMKARFDLFLGLFSKDTGQVLEATKEFNPTLHFLAVEKDGGFETANGNMETEEYLRAVCVNKYYPDKIRDYLNCRVSNINSGWWEDCAAGMDAGKIKACARGSEGKTLLRENISMNKEVGVLYGPVYMIDNKEIFSSKGVPSKEELKRIIK